MVINHKKIKIGFISGLFYISITYVIRWLLPLHDHGILLLLITVGYILFLVFIIKANIDLNKIMLVGLIFDFYSVLWYPTAIYFVFFSIGTLMIMCSYFFD